MSLSIPAPESLLDRQCEQRSESGYLAAVLADPTHRTVLFYRGKALTVVESLAWLPAAAVPAELPEGTIEVYLGRTLPANSALPEGTDLLLQLLPDDAESPAWVPEGTEFAGFRTAALGLDPLSTEVFIQAQAVANWHTSHSFCPKCGGSTAVESAGWMRRCSRDGSEHFPRTDPAAIVAIVGADDRILLANNFQWESNHYSTVAGFVEAGESGEQAAVREIAEEVGVSLHALDYVGSQAWPFPRSLMLGYMGHTLDVEATPDRTEVKEARWFTRQELQAAVLSGEARISHRASIARALIEHWYGGTIIEPELEDAAESAGVSRVRTK